MLVLPHSSSRSRCQCFLLEHPKLLGRALINGQIESRLDFEGDFRRGYRPFQDDVSLFLPAPDTTRLGWHTWLPRTENINHNLNLIETLPFRGFLGLREYTTFLPL
jgi:hypothetical protein